MFYEERLFGDVIPYGAWKVEGYSFPLHFHRSFEVANLTEGKILLQIDGVGYEAEAGDTVVIFPEQMHSITAAGNNRVILLQFSPEMIGDFYGRYQGLIPENNILRDRMLPEDAVFSENLFLQKGALYQLLGELSEMTRFKPADITGSHTTLHRVLSHIEHHFTESCTLKETADSLGYDYTYLSRFFKKHTRLSYTQYLNRCRIQYAVELLKSQDTPIYEIAYQCGYGNVRNFNRIFLEVTGLTPSQMRENVRGEADNRQE